MEMPSWRGLASARLTLFGTVRQVRGEAGPRRAAVQVQHSEENMSSAHSEFHLVNVSRMSTTWRTQNRQVVDPIEYLSCSRIRCGRAVQNPLELLNDVNEGIDRDAEPVSQLLGQDHRGRP